MYFAKKQIALLSKLVVLELIFLASPVFAGSDVDTLKSGAQRLASSLLSTNKTILRGGVSHTVSPFKEDGSTETLPTGQAVNLTLNCNLNSELSQVGDQVRAMVSVDIKDGKKILLPGQWFVVGKVTRVEKQKRAGRDGYIEIHFDKLISPGGKFEVPVDTTVSTKDSYIKSVTEHIVKDTGYVAVGGLGGALMSVQVTGLPLAVATHGLSVAAGAAMGGGIGAVAAARRQGKILSAIPGDELHFKLSKPVVLPAFNADALPSADPLPKLEGLDFLIEEWKFKNDPSGDRKSRLLAVSFKINNTTNKTFSLGNIAVMSDRKTMYSPYFLSPDIKERSKKVMPGSVIQSSLTFGVASPKYKYYLVLLDPANSCVLSQTPIN